MTSNIESSYNEYLLKKIKEIFPKKEVDAFLDANETERPTVVRANTLKTNRKELMQMLYNRKVDADALEWCEEGIVAFKSGNPLGATPEYLAGYYAIQGASSFLAVLNMEILENQTVVDLCAAPGGKTTYLAALMQNTGVLYANELCKDRTYSLKGNVHRMGVTNCIITNMDALDFSIKKVDRVLLDAPCSGTGIISKDKSVKTSKTASEIKKTQKLQQKLILHAFDMLKQNGFMVYSTCSFLVEENEEVVDYLLRNRKNARIDIPDVGIGRDGFTSFRGKDFSNELKKAKRIYPHVHNMHGFFYVKIKKI